MTIHEALLGNHDSRKRKANANVSFIEVRAHCKDYSKAIEYQQLPGMSIGKR